MVSKYGTRKTIHVFLICWCPDQKSLDSKEVLYIRHAMQMWGDQCINIDYGGRGGKKGEEHKRKIGQALKQHTRSPEHCANLGLALLGRVMEEGAKENIRSGLIKHYDTDQGLIRRSIHSKTMKEYFTTTKGKAEAEALGDRVRGVPKSEEHRRKISKSNLGKKFSRESIEKGKATRALLPPVECPHCGYSSNSRGNMGKWHFSNCKENPDLDPRSDPHKKQALKMADIKRRERLKKG
jgi:hypothetical protein